MQSEDTSLKVETFNKQNMLSIPELLTAWSAGGAYNLYQEKELGTLEKEKKLYCRIRRKSI